MRYLEWVCCYQVVSKENIHFVQSQVQDVARNILFTGAKSLH